MGGFGDYSGYIKLKNTLIRDCPLLSPSLLICLANAFVADTEKFDGMVALTRGSVLLEILQQLIPGDKRVPRHAAYGEGKSPEEGATHRCA